MIALQRNDIVCFTFLVSGIPQVEDGTYIRITIVALDTVSWFRAAEDGSWNVTGKFVVETLEQAFQDSPEYMHVGGVEWHQMDEEEDGHGPLH